MVKFLQKTENIQNSNEIAHSVIKTSYAENPKRSISESHKHLKIQQEFPTSKGEDLGNIDVQVSNLNQNFYSKKLI